MVSRVARTRDVVTRERRGQNSSVNDSDSKRRGDGCYTRAQGCGAPMDWWIHRVLGLSVRGAWWCASYLAHCCLSWWCITAMS